MKKLSILLSALLLAPTVISANDQDGKAEPKKQPTKEQIQQTAQKFNKLLQQQVAFKDADALRIMAGVKKNNGELTIDYNEMTKLLKKWGTSSITQRFTKLFPAKVKENDKDALELSKKAQENGGKLNLTPEKMTELVKKWEADDAKKSKKSQ